MMCEFHDSNSNGFGDIWWADKLIYFSSRPYPIDSQRAYLHLQAPGLDIVFCRNLPDTCTSSSHSDRDIRGCNSEVPALHQNTYLQRNDRT